ncbi:MAG: hypothetical protein HY519_04625 [Candidatus Aenigmarchaeota archaeon]|nr:hypothetical protein [Candidatus Aenigmarchaeota archaeon]
MPFFPGKEQAAPLESREYKLFKKFDNRRLSWYESLAQTAGKLVRLKASNDFALQLRKAISFAGMRIRPDDVMSLALLSFLAFLLVTIPLAVSGFLPLTGALLIVSIGIMVAYYLLNYPLSLLKEMRIQASSQIILAILYMVVSMRISPNLEHALKFAASNVTGPLAWDMRRLIWDIELRIYPSAWHALDDYIAKWKPENEEFAEAIRLIRESTSQTPEKAKAVLDEALNIVLEGSKTRMKHYAQDLKLPVMIIHMMGIVLPVLGSIMAPLVAVFLADIARPEYFFFGYDIALPLVIIWFINDTLRKRPTTFAQSAERDGKQSLLPAMLGIGAFVVLAGYPIYYFATNPDIFFGSFLEREDTTDIMPLILSSLIIVGAAVGLAVYYILSSYRQVKFSSDISAIESEFELALFQLGNRVASGTPAEVAMEKAIQDVKDLKIAKLLTMALQNMKGLGMTFEAALFDKRYGALRYYPSRLIRSIMQTIVDTAKKGLAYAADSMFRISKYLKNIRETQEYMRDLLEETVSSMKFQAYFLTPLVGGLVVAMAAVIIAVIGNLGKYLGGIGEANQLGISVEDVFGDVSKTMSPELFQMIVGIYMLEVTILLAIFVTKIKEGENQAAQRYTAGKMLLVAVFVYFVVLVVSTSLFSEFINQALEQLKPG